MIPYFDGHNDSLYCRLLDPKGPRESFVTGSSRGHLDLPRALSSGFHGGFFAVWVPTGDGVRDTLRGVDLPGPITHQSALRTALRLVAELHRWAEASEGRFRICRTVDQIRTCVPGRTVAAVLHFEGAEPLDPELDSLEVFHAAGLRSLGLVWSRKNAFGQGVPFRCPQSPDIGEGLTPLGRRLVLRAGELGILLDLAHLNERGFWEVAELSSSPLVSTHTAAHALCPSARNLTDRQLTAVAGSGGVVGLNFYVGDLHPEGSSDPALGIDRMVEHLDHLVDLMGIEHVALGSDFDGATVSDEIGDVTGVPRLFERLMERGYSRRDVDLIAHDNWIRVLERTWK